MIEHSFIFRKIKIFCELTHFSPGKYKWYMYLYHHILCETQERMVPFYTSFVSMQTRYVFHLLLPRYYDRFFLYHCEDLTLWKKQAEFMCAFYVLRFYVEKIPIPDYFPGGMMAVSGVPRDKMVSYSFLWTALILINSRHWLVNLSIILALL